MLSCFLKNYKIKGDSLVMDIQTVESYEKFSETIAKVHSSLIPSRLYEIIKNFFIPNGLCIDIGCGIGRDIDWLNKNGYHAAGVDASNNMLGQAIKMYPNLNLIQDSLPFLYKISNEAYHNTLCSAVIMHIPSEQLILAIENIVRITKDNGIIIMSFRDTKSENNRENGKLYSFIEEQHFISMFQSNNCSLLLSEVNYESERDFNWYNFVFKKLKGQPV